MDGYEMTHSFYGHGRGSLLSFKVICQISRSHRLKNQHYGDVIMGMIASQITSLTIVYSIVYSDSDQRKHQSSASLAFVWGIHRGLVNSPHCEWPVNRKMVPFDDVIMNDLDAIWSRLLGQWQLSNSSDLPCSHANSWFYIFTLHDAVSHI